MVQKTEKEDLKKFKSVPETLYFHSDKEFGEALGSDFIAKANAQTKKNKYFLVGLAHGQSPSYAYEYILKHYDEIVNPELIWFTFTNSRFEKQRDLEVMDSFTFMRALIKKQYTKRSQVFGADFTRENLPKFVKQYNQEVSEFLKENNKKGYDYVFLASNPIGKVAGINKDSKAFQSEDIMVVVDDAQSGDLEITVTPHFLLKAKRIAYIATKADKRRSLAWLYSKWSNQNQSPSFLRFLPNIEDKMSVFIDDKALTWPQIELKRKSEFGTSNIKLDFAIDFDENAPKKKPVIIMIHGFLGLNSFDSLLTHFPTQKYVATAMHYGSIPNKLKPEEYSENIVRNIDFVVKYFGKLGHDVYILDHSIANIYFLLQDKHYDKLKGIQKYLKGRIGINPFFAEEAKHASLGFLDYVIIPALRFKKSPGWKSAVLATRALMPFDTKKGARKKGIKVTKWLIKDEKGKDNSTIWSSLKERIIEILTNMDSLPHVNIIPLKKALSRLNSKLFAIQIYSALTDYKQFDKQTGLTNFEEKKLPILIIKSERDAVAKYVPRFYKGKNVEVLDVTRYKEKNLFREHLYHLLYPKNTVEIVSEFINKMEASN